MWEMDADGRLLLLGLVTVLIGLVLTRTMQRTFLRFRSRERKVGKELVYRHFPRHKKPLGGGVAILGTLLAGVSLAFVFYLHVPLIDWLPVGFCLLAAVLFAGIGFIDDWRKVQAARGISEWVKLALQTAAAVLLAYLLVLARNPGEGIPQTAVFIPFFNWVELRWFFLPFGAFVIVAMTNAVNLTDGMDGLAGSTALLSALIYLLLGLLVHPDGIPLIIPVLLIAALTAFLVYNRPTAKIIMGDTGALSLGAVLAVLALLSGTEWLLLLVGAPFVISTLSVLIQVSIIKFFRGPVRLLRHQTTEIARPFLCTPLHHHFQWLGWGPWAVLGLYCGLALFSGVLALLAAALHAPWFWLAGLLLQVGVLIFAGLQKAVRANYFLGLEKERGSTERRLALYKGLPVTVLGMPWYTVEEVTELTERMITAIAAESILWRNISEIEARATLGKIYAEYKMLDQAAAEWEEIPQRNLLIRENIVIQLGRIYFGREELLRAIKLWEQLPPARLARETGLPETIRSAKVRVGHLAARLYRQAREHAEALTRRLERGTLLPPSEIAALTAEVDAALRYTQDLRDLLTYEQRKREGEAPTDDAADSADVYRRMDALLATRREELHGLTDWIQSTLTQPGNTSDAAPLHELAKTLQLTPAEISRALELSTALPVREFTRITKPSRNNLYRITLEPREGHLPTTLVAKVYEEAQIAFFAACYRRERGVLQILHEVGALAPRVFGGHQGAHLAVLFMEDLGPRDLSMALNALPTEDRAGRKALLHHGLEALVAMRMHVMPELPRMTREIARIVKEVLTPEYFLNSLAIAVDRILALDSRRLTPEDREQLATAIEPLLTPLLEEPRIFIHFEYTPGNLQLCDGRVIPVDFEQSTMGPAAFDLASLFYSPEADLNDAEVRELLDNYHELLPQGTPPAYTTRPELLEAAAILKLVFYAGSAANFYRRFDDTRRLDVMEWYLRTADRLLLHRREYFALAELIRTCRPRASVG